MPARVHRTRTWHIHTHTHQPPSQRRFARAHHKTTAKYGTLHKRPIKYKCIIYVGHGLIYMYLCWVGVCVCKSRQAYCFRSAFRTRKLYCGNEVKLCNEREPQHFIGRITSLIPPTPMPCHAAVFSILGGHFISDTKERSRPLRRLKGITDKYDTVSGYTQSARTLCVG